MKKFNVLFALIILLLTGFSVFFSNQTIETVSAEIRGKEFVNLVLTGRQGYYPYTYFDNLTQSIHTDDDIYYYNESGILTNSYRAIKYKVNSYFYEENAENLLDKYIDDNLTPFFAARHSSGTVDISLASEMRTLVDSGKCFVYAKAGLLALDNADKSKVQINVSVGEQSANATSNRVHSGGEYSPEWVVTDKVYITDKNQIINFSFSTLEKSSLWDQANFLIFEPTICFGVEIDEISVSSEVTNVSPGQLLRLQADTSLSQMPEGGALLSYYKNYHKIEWEIIEGQNLANISGTYLNVTGQSGTIKVRAKCRKATGSSEYTYSDIITFNIDNSTYALTLESNFPDGGATLLGGGPQPKSRLKTTIFTIVEEGHQFLYYKDKDTGEILSHTFTASGSYMASVTLGRSRTIVAVLVRDVSISEIRIKDKYYDKTDVAEIEEIVIPGLLPEHNVTIQNNLTALFPRMLPEDGLRVSLTGNVQLAGDDAYMYNFTPTLPREVTGNIKKRELVVEADYLSKEYGENDLSLTYRITGGNLLDGDLLAGGLDREPGQIPGVYEISLGTLGHSYYQIIFISNIYEIQTRKIRISNIAVEDKIYDGTDLISGISFTKTGTFLSENLTLSYQANFESCDAGLDIPVIFMAWVDGPEEKNYYEVVINSGTITADISPKPLNITAESKSKIYGDHDPALTYIYNPSDLVAGDSLTGTPARSSGENFGIYTISIGSLYAKNYEIIFTSANFVINKRALKISGNNLEKQYGDNDPSLTYTITEGQVVSGDELGLILTRQAGENIGDYQIYIQNQINLNYIIEFTSSQLTIQKRTISIYISAKDKFYDGTRTAETLIEITNAMVQDELSLSVTSEFDDVNVGEREILYYNNGQLITAFEAALVSGYNLSNYNITFYITPISNINRKELIVAIAEDAVISKIYGDAEGEIKYSVSGLVDGETLFGKLARTQGENVGSYNINQGTITNENNPNYYIIFDSSGVLFTITKRDLKVIVDSLQITYGDIENSIIYYISPSTPLPIGIVLSDILEGNPTRQQGINCGQYNYLTGSLTVKQSMKNNYNFIFEGGTLTINKRIVSITLDNKTKTYGEDDPVFTYQIIGSLINENDLIFIREAGETVGEYTINAYISNENYQWDVTPSNLNIAPAQITVRAYNLFKTYGQPDPSLMFVISSGVLMFNDTIESVFTGELTRVLGENIGSYTINQGTLSTNSNYNFIFITGTLVINKKMITVTANPAQKFLDEEGTPEFTYSATGLINGDQLNGYLTVGSTNGVGEYDILLGTLNSPNYSINFISAKYSITKRALYIIIDDISKEYDATENASYTYSVDGDIKEGDEDNLNIVLIKDHGVDVGRYRVTAVCLNDKYEAVITEGYIDILPRRVTIKADDIEITYGEELPDPSLWTYTVIGEIINNELTINLYRSPNYCAGVFTIFGSVLNANNYDVTFQTGTLTILRKTIYITVADFEKTYGQSDPTFHYVLEEGALYSGDFLQGSIERESGENVGQYNLICSLTNSNYIIVMNQAKLTILPKELALVTTALDKTFDGTDVCYVRTPIISGIIEGDDVSFLYEAAELARFDNPEVGDNKNVIVYGGQLIGTAAANYYLTRPVGLTASITNIVVKDENIEVYAFKTNTNLKAGTTLVSTNIDKSQIKGLFGNNKNIIDSYDISLLYNNETFESYGSLTVTINLSGTQKYFNVQLYHLKEDGTMELIKSEYSDNSVTFQTDKLGSYVIIADNDLWLDYSLLIISAGFIILALSIILSKKIRARKNK